MRFGRSRSCSRPLSLPAVKPSLEEFRALAEKGNVVPVYAQLAADFETPLSAYLKIRDGQHAFLLESAESTDASGRWSIVGSYVTVSTPWVIPVPEGKGAAVEKLDDASMAELVERHWESVLDSKERSQVSR